MISTKKRIFQWGSIPGRPIYVSYWVIIYSTYYLKLHKYIWPESYLIFHKEKMMFIGEMEALEVTGQKVFREVITTPRVKKIWREWRQRAADLFLFCKKISSQNVKSLSDSELLKYWNKFNNLGIRFWEVGILPELGAYGGEPELRQALKKEKLTAQGEREAFSILSAPVRLSFYQEEERDLLKVMKHYKAKSFNRLLEKHQKNYFWLGNSYYQTKMLNKNFFLKRISGKKRAGINPALALKDMQQHLCQTKHKKAQLILKLHHKKEIKNIADNLSYCIWWQDQRKKYIFQYLHYFILLVNEFARRSKISPRVFDYAWINEVRLNPSRHLVSALKKRRKGYYIAHFWKNNKRFYQGEKAKRIAQQFQPKRQKIGTSGIEGVVVYFEKKLISGRVFVIREVKDIKKFPRGRILVTTMTAPEYITAIRKAKAIVTDTGGLTCHAAIVARELKVPCIVGTKIATRVLRNGDKVEVDATKGIVRKI